MITFGKRRISTIVLSTALGPDGRGIFPYTLWPAYRRLLRAVRENAITVITKSATRFPRRGNFVPTNPFTWKYIQRLPQGGMLNAYGLTNDGVAAVAPRIGAACREGFQVIPNFWPEFTKGSEQAVQETQEAVALYRQNLGEAFWALELNLSCPNVPEDMACNLADGLACVRAVKAAHPGLFLIAKISIRHPYEFAQELEGRGRGSPRHQHHSLRTGLPAQPISAFVPGRRGRRRHLRRPGLGAGLSVQPGPASPGAYAPHHGLRRLR